MFEFSQNQKNTFSINNHFDEWLLSQQRSVPTEPLNLLMHRYLLIKSYRKPSVALWVHPLRKSKDDTRVSILTDLNSLIWSARVERGSGGRRGQDITASEDHRYSRPRRQSSRRMTCLGPLYPDPGLSDEHHVPTPRL